MRRTPLTTRLRHAAKVSIEKWQGTETREGLGHLVDTGRTVFKGWASVRLSVCSIVRQSLRRVAGLLLSATRTGLID